MKFLILLLIPCIAFASVEKWSQEWRTVMSVQEQHPGYQSGDVLKKPAGTWQLLFSILRAGRAIDGLAKDCVWIYVPLKDDGVLKVITVHPTESCENKWENYGWIEEKDLHAIQFVLQSTSAQFWLTDITGRVHTWKADFLNTVKKAEFKLFESSVEKRKIPGVFFFSPNTLIDIKQGSQLIGKMEDEYPQSVCSYKDGSCLRCRFGVYRVKAGDETTYYCGIDRCGEKNQPACERGVTWQRLRQTFTCRGDNSHVYCLPGLKVECVGEQAICR
jgi:hypothetical protein